MAWPGVFSPDGSHVAAKVERDNAYTFVLDGKELDESFDQIWDPVFSPDGEKILLRYIKDDEYLRRVMRVEDF
jgi:Tol biopolymer transport system component